MPVAATASDPGSLISIFSCFLSLFTRIRTVFGCRCLLIDHRSIDGPTHSHDGTCRQLFIKRRASRINAQNRALPSLTFASPMDGKHAEYSSIFTSGIRKEFEKASVRVRMALRVIQEWQGWTADRQVAERTLLASGSSLLKQTTSLSRRISPICKSGCCKGKVTDRAVSQFPLIPLPQACAVSPCAGRDWTVR